YKRMTAAIREVDPNHIVIFGGAQWDSNFKVFGAPFDRNSAYTFHKYWTEPTVAVIQEYLDFSKRYDVPIWMGESGENTDEWITTFRTMLDEHEVGWCFWPYKKLDNPRCVATIARPNGWDAIV